MRAHFEGALCVEIMGGGRDIVLIEPFAFVDAGGYRWEVHEGTRVDGSSNPRWLWPLIGSPFVGKHRRASVPHDLYCRERIRTWQATHKMYHEAMIIDGVPDGEADRKLWFLMRFGPRWPAPQPQMHAREIKEP
jgi:hypothetical protein